MIRCQVRLSGASHGVAAYCVYFECGCPWPQSVIMCRTCAARFDFMVRNAGGMCRICKTPPAVFELRPV